MIESFHKAPDSVRRTDKAIYSISQHFQLYP
ncbi:hypothetical protein T4B_8074 [Trichinella pseudospiralis]|uniref:Uncharacterized protein n=1 Tax=Trichinella pseudospiralis TaxID=6337 RepID=A0A0V1GR31_TRIPS|nr:hypothetical protein T4B_8074 [Trichinella pseudospiralis]KRZ02458.1 hypothetical protein T4C_13243 [Trichinella pseudospiralis]